MQDVAHSVNMQDVPVCVLYILGGIIVLGLLLDIGFLLRVGFKHAPKLQILHPLPLDSWTWHQALIIVSTLALLHGILLLSIRAVTGWGLLPETDTMNIAMVVHTLFFHVAGLVVILLLLRSTNRSWQESFGFAVRKLPKQAAYAVAFYLAAMPVVALAGWVYTAFLTDIGYPVTPHDTQQVVGIFTEPGYPLWFKIYMGILAVTVAPLTEELLFRGIGLSLLARHTRTGIAVFAVSVSFAMLHFHIPSLVPLFVIAVAFSYAYVYSGSIVVPVIMHSLFNTVGILSAILMRNSPAAAFFFLPQ